MNPDGAASRELRAAGYRWVILSWIRQGILVVGDLLLLRALAM